MGPLRLATMLPALPTPARLPGPARWSVLWAVLLLPLLALWPAGCFSPASPPRLVVLEALSLQIQLTQTAVSRALSLEPTPAPQVSRVRVEQQQSVPIGDSRGLRLSGRFDWRLADDPIRVDSPFELFLQRGERGQSWRLARPIGSQDGVQQWLTDPLPLPERQRS